MSPQTHKRFSEALKRPFTFQINAIHPSLRFLHSSIALLSSYPPLSPSNSFRLLSAMGSLNTVSCPGIKEGPLRAGFSTLHAATDRLLPIRCGCRMDMMTAIRAAKKCRPVVDPIGMLPEFLKRLQRMQMAGEGTPGRSPMGKTVSSSQR